MSYYYYDVHESHFVDSERKPNFVSKKFSLQVSPDAFCATVCTETCIYIRGLYVSLTVSVVYSTLKETEVAFAFHLVECFCSVSQESVFRLLDQ
jgi:hypothetical protein